MNTIIDAISIWTTAQKLKTSGRGRSASNQSLHGINKLRELILELAVRGKLVPQDSSDEPASVLLEKIKKDKNRLIKAGKIKKQESLPEISEDEKPFFLPTGWAWVKLGDISEFINGFAFKSADFKDTGIGIVKIGDIQNGEITTLSMSRVNENIVAGIDDSLKINKGDLLIAMSGATTGKLGFNKTDEIFYINQRVGKILPYSMLIDYLIYPLTTQIAENLAKSMGSAIPNLSTVQIKNIVFALPPLAEQHRIVSKVDELMALCDQLEQQQTDSNSAHEILVETLLDTLTNAPDQADLESAWQRISNHFDVLFTTEYSIDRLKQTILQLAVMGKLVPQNPHDEPAYVLLKKIAKEKARLVKEGKIKKQTPLAVIDKDEEPYSLPNNWIWAKIGDASLFTEYGMSEMTFDGIAGIPVLKMGDIQGGKVLLGGQKLVPENVEGIPSLYLKKWDLLYNRTNSAELVGKTGIFEGYDDKYTFASYLIRIRCSESCVHPKYLNLSMNSPLFRLTQIDPHLKQQCGQANVNGTILKNMIVSVPPIAEQRRIVAKVDELFAVCDALKERISESQVTQLNLADALVDGAVG